jgi:hypothetical protein
MGEGVGERFALYFSAGRFHSLIFSPFGRDKVELPGGEKSFSTACWYRGGATVVAITSWGKLTNEILPLL